MFAGVLASVLLALAAPVAVPQTAHAQAVKEIFSRTLTVGASTTATSTAFGFAPSLTGGSLGTRAERSIAEFKASGTDDNRYISLVTNENASGGTLTFSITAAGSGQTDLFDTAAFNARLTFHVGTASFAGADATRTDTGNTIFAWNPSGLTWAASQMIALRLTLSVPGVNSIAFKSAGADNTFALGDAVTATVTFNEAVTVTGTPQLEIDVGGSPKTLNYSSGSGSTALVFTGFTVAAGEEDTDGLAVAANKLTLNGGTIKASAGGNPDAVLTHAAVAASANHKVDGVKPTLVTTGTDAPKTSTDGTKVILTFSENITLTFGTAFVTPYTVAIGGTAVTVDSVEVTPGNLARIELMLASTDTVAGGDTVTVAVDSDAVLDGAGNGNAARAATSVTVTVEDNTAPTLVSAVANEPFRTQVDLHFDETLVSTSIPAASAFTVKVEGNSRTPTNATRQVGGKTIGLDLDAADAIKPGETVTISCTKPTGTGANPLKDAASNEVASFTDVAVTNLLAATAPDAPGNLVATATHADKVALNWDTPWNNGSAITRFEYRSAVGGSVPASAAWTAVPDSGPTTTGSPVVLLAPGTEHAFEVRAVNGEGEGDEAAATATTLTPTWSFTLRDSSDNNVTQLTEGGDPATAEVSITNNVRFSTEQTVQLKWGNSNLEALDVVEGAGDVGTINIPAEGSSGSLEISSPQRADDSYDTPITFALTATHGGTVIGNSIQLTRVDDDAPPVATITQSPSSVDEGENIQVEISLDRRFEQTSASERTIKFAVTDADNALSGTPPASEEISQNSTITLTAADNSTMNDGAHEVTFALQLNDDSPYTLGTPNSVTITVRDDDTPPLAPENLRAQAGNAEATLRWDPPLASTPDHGQPVLHYESRVKVGTAAFGSWTTILNSDATTTSHTFTGLTNGTEYTYEVRAENVAGDGAAAQVAVTPIVGVAVSFGAATLSVNEGGTGQVTLTLAPAPAAGTTVTVPITATPGEGLGTGEYSGVASSVTFSAGETSNNFTMTAVQDTVDEPDEVLTLSLGTLPAGYVPGTAAELEITVVDDDVARLGLTLRDSGSNDVTQLVEGGAPATVEVSITNGVTFSTEQTVTLEWGGAEITSGLIQGASGSATVTIPANGNSGTLEISAPQGSDDLYQPPLTETLTAIHAGTQFDERIDLTFVDDEEPPVLSLRLPSTRITEGDTFLVLADISRGYAALNQFFGIAKITGDIGKLTPADYNTTDSTVDAAFHMGDSEGSRAIAALDNTIPGDHGEVVFTVPTDNPLFTVGSPSSVTLTILDDDAAPTAPRNIAAQARDGSVILTWDLPTSYDTTEITAYELRYIAGNTPRRNLRRNLHQRRDNEPHGDGAHQRRRVHLRGAGEERRGPKPRRKRDEDAECRRGGVVRRGVALGRRGRQCRGDADAGRGAGGRDDGDGADRGLGARIQRRCRRADASDLRGRRDLEDLRDACATGHVRRAGRGADALARHAAGRLRAGDACDVRADGGGRRRPDRFGDVRRGGGFGAGGRLGRGDGWSEPGAGARGGGADQGGAGREPCGG